MKLKINNKLTMHVTKANKDVVTYYWNGDQKRKGSCARGSFHHYFGEKSAQEIDKMTEV